MMSILVIAIFLLCIYTQRYKKKGLKIAREEDKEPVFELEYKNKDLELKRKTSSISIIRKTSSSQNPISILKDSVNS